MGYAVKLQGEDKKGFGGILNAQWSSGNYGTFDIDTKIKNLKIFIIFKPYENRQRASLWEAERPTTYSALQCPGTNNGYSAYNIGLNTSSNGSPPMIISITDGIVRVRLNSKGDHFWCASAVNERIS